MNHGRIVNRLSCIIQESPSEKPPAGPNGKGAAGLRTRQPSAWTRPGTGARSRHGRSRECLGRARATRRDGIAPPDEMSQQAGLQSPSANSRVLVHYRITDQLARSRNAESHDKAVSHCFFSDQ